MRVTSLNPPRPFALKQSIPNFSRAAAMLHSGREAIDHLCRADAPEYDAVLLDICMPDCDGRFFFCVWKSMQCSCDDSKWASSMRAFASMRGKYAGVWGAHGLNPRLSKARHSLHCRHTGYDVITAVRKFESEQSPAAGQGQEGSPKKKPLHVIALTAMSLSTDRDRAIELGMNDYVVKVRVLLQPRVSVCVRACECA